MGNVCVCCKWGRDGHYDENGKQGGWTDQYSKPLVTAKHDLGALESDEADGLIKRKVLMRSPRPGSASTQESDRNYSPSRYQQQYEPHKRSHHKHKVKAASIDSNKYSKGAKFSDDREHPNFHGELPPIHYLSRRIDVNDDREWRTNRSTSLEVQDSAKDFRSSSSPARSPRGIQDAASCVDDDFEGVDPIHGLMRLHQSSPNESLSPKTSSKCGSPHKNSRYGRKHYRADANRK